MKKEKVKEQVKLLGEVELFSSLSRKSLEALAGICTERSFAKDEILVKQNEPGIGLFIIVSGKVKVIKETVRGKQFEMAIQGPGDFIGEMTVLDGAPRSASVVAIEDTDCLMLTSWEFNAEMKAHPEIALGVLPVIVKRFRDTNKKLIEMTQE